MPGLSTSVAQQARAAERDLIRTFVTRVVAVSRIGPRSLEVTCGGGDLADFRPLGPDQFVHVLAPPIGATALPIDRRFTWTAYEQMPAEERPIGAYYTVRRVRQDVAEVDLVVVLHDPPGDGSTWAQRVRPGDPVALWGPRRVFDPPPTATRWLLVGDETGLPAIAAILESVAASDEGRPARIDVIVEAGDEHGRLPLPKLPDEANVTISWLRRGGLPAGTTKLLADAVRRLQLDAAGLYAWGGAESRAMTDVRRFLHDDVGLDRDAIAMTAYWRRAP